MALLIQYFIIMGLISSHNKIWPNTFKTTPPSLSFSHFIKPFIGTYKNQIQKQSLAAMKHNKNWSFLPRHQDTGLHLIITHYTI